MPVYKFIKESFPPDTADMAEDLCSRCADFLDELTGIDSINLPAVIVGYEESGNPYICNGTIPSRFINIGIHNIKLNKFIGSVEGSIINQFSHEWMHHLLGEKLPQEKGGLHWLEETICAMASLKTLNNFENLIPGLNIQDLLASLRHQTKQIDHDIQDAQAFSEILPELKNIEETRLYQYAFALRLLPVFEAHPSLWRIAASLGHFVYFDTLEDYFGSLRKSFDDEKDLKAIDAYQNVFPTLQR